MYKQKYRMVFRFFLLISLIFLSFDHPRLVKTKVADGITVSIPRGWRPMDGLDFTQRYPSVRAPLAAFTNEERIADFSVNTSATQWPDADLNIAQQFFKSSVMNMFDRVEMLHEGIIEVRGKRFVFFEFESRVNGNRTEQGLTDPVMRYTYLQYLIEPDRTLVFSFNCPKRDRERWQSTAAAVMKSIKIK
jgi:hypothetical protein